MLLSSWLSHVAVSCRRRASWFERLSALTRKSDHRRSRRAAWRPSQAEANGHGLQLEQLEDRCLLAVYLVDYTGGGNNPFADSTDSATHGGSGTSGDPFHMASLRGAILATNAAAGADTINLPAGTYTLTIAGQEHAALTGDLDITSTVTIVGAGQASTIVQAGTTQAAAIDDVFSVGDVSATFQSMTIRHGNIGIYDASSTLSLPNKLVTVDHVTVTANQEFGIFTGRPSPSSFAVTHSTVSNNGGGLTVFGDVALTVSDSVFSGNTYDEGAAVRLIFASGNPINNSAIVTNSTFTNNVATDPDRGGGAIVNFGGSLVVSGCTFSNNSAAGSGGAIGQQIGASATIVNSTFSNNSAAFGGAIANNGNPNATINMTSHMTIVNSTIANNSATYSSGAGGGIVNGSSTTSGAVFGSLDLQNTIVANNTSAGAGFPQAGGADIFNRPFTGSITASYSLIGDTTGSGISGGTGNILNPSYVGVGSLASNGGQTQTIALLRGSPALEGGSNSLATNAGLTTDQRGSGYSRVVLGTVDIGAFEADAGVSRNALPSISSVALTPTTAFENTTLTATPQGAFDPEGETISHS